MKKRDPIERIDVKHITDPNVVKKMSYPELAVLCHDLRREILESVSKTGGHLSSNLGVIELTVALYRNFDFPNDKLIFDVGHQCYAHKLLSGRSLENLNKPGGVAGFQKMAESEFDPWEAGHSSTSISAAEAFAIAAHKKGETRDVVAVIGDSSVVNGLSFEALNDLGSRPEKVIVVLNDNDMSISRPTGSFGRFFRRISTGKVYTKAKKGYQRALFRSRLGHKIYNFSLSFKNAIKARLVPLTMFDNMGFNYIGPVDGHDLKALDRAIARAKRSTKSVVLHVRTIKGKGYPYAENDKTGYWHGVTPFDLETGAPKKFHPGQVSWSHFMADLTYEMIANHPEAQLVVPATLKGSGLEKVFSSYPDRCIDVGIAEEHAATLCGAFSVNGFKPILTIYSTFLQRAYDEIAHDCARIKANVTLLIDRAGLVGSNGDTHQGIYDVAYLKSIPGVTVTMPSSKAMAKTLYEQSLTGKGVFAIRYPRDFVEEGMPLETISDLQYLRFRYERRTSSKKIAVLAVGPMEKKLLDLVEKAYLDVEIIDPVYLQPLQMDNLLPLLSFEHIFVYDAYSTKEGFASSVLTALMELGYKGKVTVRAVPNQFVREDSYDNQLAQFGLLPTQIVEELRKLLGV